MSIDTSLPTSASGGAIVRERVRKRHFKLPITLAVATALIWLMAFVFGRDGVSTYRLGDRTASIDLGDIGVPTAPAVTICAIVLALLTAYAFWAVATFRKVGLWVPIVFALLAVFAFLTWSAAGGLVPVTGLLFGAVSLSVPLVFGALGGVIGERVGVVNVAIEAQFLFAAFSSAVIASITGSVLLGLVGALVAGALVGAVLAVFSIKYLVEQVIVGVVLNVLITGLTSFLHGALLNPNSEALNSPPRFPRVPIPFLSEIPILGPVVFNQTLIVYIMYLAVPLVAWGLYKTRWGLRLRAVGEHPQAADTVGIKVNPTRFWNVLLAGAIAGIGGAYFTLGSVGSFDKEMTGGLGFIALAAVIFGGWDPVRATLAALLFGFTTNLETLLTNLGSPIPSEFMAMLPYIVTVLAVVGFAGQVRAPAAAGKPYIKG
ncbi:MAG: ABC transporter permease [Microbacterium sp.]|uniref:ABC transporter permease n=1 Tax=unclassified Microbacterium TaxID=2609290 RepID=UPI000C548ADF|nr:MULTISPECIES: ABC transporter permease [unclassified Microbacterium]MAY50182.1 ABC transporter permease [Microbacterium sp.]|tara:strand:- start:2590 stop:3882 length:1293 start_codon:yes stop_codon:yes gene_type:complete